MSDTINRLNHAIRKNNEEIDDLKEQLATLQKDNDTLKAEVEKMVSDAIIDLKNLKAQQERAEKAEAEVEREMKARDKAEEQLGYVREERDRLRESLEELCCEARYLASHEIDGGAPENRWEDMRIALCASENLINHKEK